MIFLISSSAMLSSVEKRIYKKDKWKIIGRNKESIYDERNYFYEIEIEDLNELMEMCVYFGHNFYGIIVSEISESTQRSLLISGIATQAKFEIVCYNSWVE